MLAFILLDALEHTTHGRVLSSFLLPLTVFTDITTLVGFILLEVLFEAHRPDFLPGGMERGEDGGRVRWTFLLVFVKRG